MDRIIYQNLLNNCNDLFDCCIRIFKPGGALLAATKKDADLSAPSLSRTIEIDDIPLCVVSIWTQDPEPVFCYIKAALELASNYHSDSSQDHVMKKMYITNQIIDSGGHFTDISTLAKDLRLNLNRSRCAIIIELGLDMEFPSQDQEVFNSNSASLTDLYRLFSADDIYGIVSDRRFVVFKALPQWESDRKSYLEQFLRQVRECLFRSSLKKKPFFCVGKAYPSLFQLKWSYQEAAFISDNSNLFFSSGAEDTVFIEQCLSDYLMSLVPADLIKTRLDKQVSQLTPELLETLKALSWNDFNVTKTATTLNLHRNTVIQRINKIKTSLEIDDIKSIKNKIQFRELSLHYNKKLILHGAITISPHSALFDAFQHFARLVNQNSNGAILLNVHSLSDSGDNALLFQTLRSGNIDFVVVDTSVLNKVTNDLTAVLDLPFLFDSEKQAFRIMNTLILSEFNNSLSLSGVSCLAIWSMGWRYITSHNTPIRVPADLESKKIRIMENKTLDALFKNIGAFPVQMNFSSVYEALASGLIDGQENPCSNIINMKFYKHQTYLTEMDFNFDTEALLVSSNTWMKLPKEYKEILIRSAQETTAWLTNELTASSPSQKDYLRDSCNMILVPVSKQEQSLWKAKASALYQNFPHKVLLKMIQSEKERLQNEL